MQELEAELALEDGRQLLADEAPITASKAMAAAAVWASFDMSAAPAIASSTPADTRSTARSRLLVPSSNSRASTRKGRSSSIASKGAAQEVAL